MDQAIAFLRRARTELPRYWFHHAFLAGALGLKGDIDEAQAEIAEMLKLKPEVNSVARWRAIAATMGGGDLRNQALVEKTLFTGLRRAGFRDE
jgi:adenylate cyclase